MGPDLEIKNQSNGGTEVLVCKENISMPGDSENKVVQCVNNSKDNNFDGENLDVDRGKVMDGDEDVEVNIIDCTKSIDVGEIEVWCDDATESMSSFGDTDSETKNGSVLSDTEVESPFFVNDGPISIFDSYGGAFQMRRKKLTDHWRRFIRPLMWRCKWVELQIKEIQSQALKYDREIAEHEQRKQFNFETNMVEGFPAKSLPFSTCIGRKKVMKRKKRKRFEDTTDLSSYMLQHNLFSFYENKRSATDGASIDDDCCNLDKTITGNDELGIQDGLASLESRDNISEHTLRKIELLQLQVHKLKARIDKMVSENPGKFSSVNALSVLAPVDALTSSDQNPASLPKNGDRIPVRSPRTLSRRMSESNMGDFVLEKEISNQGEATSHSDMIESIGQPQLRISGKNAREGILIHNDAVKREIGILNNFDSGRAKMRLLPMEKQIVQASESELPEDMLVARVRYGGKSLPKSWSNLSDNKPNVSNNKRKRGKRR